MPAARTKSTARSSPTKSCAECRRRKIRCRWPKDEDATSCSNCIARGKRCTPQGTSSHGSNEARATAHDRITRLESDVEKIFGLLDSSPHHTVGQDTSQRSTSVGATRASQNRSGAAFEDPSVTNIRSRLQSLLPTKDEVARIPNYTSVWEFSSYSLFSNWIFPQTRQELISDYDQMNVAGVKLHTLAKYLLSLAITVQLLTAKVNKTWFSDTLNANNFVNAVSRTLKETIVDSNAIATTIESVDTMLGFVTLQMFQGSIESMWFTLRRTIALAELLDLPARARGSEGVNGFNEGVINPENNPHLVFAHLWSAICACDRIVSVMFNLPSGMKGSTAALIQQIYKLPDHAPQEYAHRLFTISRGLHDIDELFFGDGTEIEDYEEVLGLDQQLRTLSTSRPPVWWDEYETFPISAQLVQLWHYYLLARIHIRTALSNDVDSEYDYSRQACRKACTSVCFKYLDLNSSSLHLESIVSDLVHTQAFTAAAMLVLLNHSPRGEQGIGDELKALHLVQKIINAFKSMNDRTQSTLAAEAFTALTAIHAFFARDHDEQRSDATLRIPFFGSIAFTRSSAPLGFGDATVDSMPWSFQVDIGQSWFSDSLSFGSGITFVVW